MKESELVLLAQVVLPQEVLSYFDIVKIESSDTEILIHLDERIPDKLKDKDSIDSKGFLPPVHITDFPIRDHKVILVIRRRRWLDSRTGKSFSFPLTIAAQGTRYSKEFAAFLKDAYGYLRDNLPYT